MHLVQFDSFIFVGSLTLHQWQRLATPHLGGFLDPRPGVQNKGQRTLEIDEEDIYDLSDIEEDSPGGFLDGLTTSKSLDLPRDCEDSIPEGQSLDTECCAISGASTDLPRSFSSPAGGGGDNNAGLAQLARGSYGKGGGGKLAKHLGNIKYQRPVPCFSQSQEDLFPIGQSGTASVIPHMPQTRSMSLISPSKSEPSLEMLGLGRLARYRKRFRRMLAPPTPQDPEEVHDLLFKGANHQLCAIM